MIRNVLFRSVRLTCGGALSAMVMLMLAAECGMAQPTYAPLFRSSWGKKNASGNPTPIAPEGFGDRQNSWAWSMAWFNGKLLVGTSRSEQCITAEAAHQVLSTQPYPPTDPDISCPTDPNQMMLQAEIWSFDPTTGIWTRVFQSPLTITVPNTNPPLLVPPDVGFRGMSIYEESNGTEALYVGSCSSLAIHPGVPGGRLLRSTDGVNFTPVPQDPGTVLGNLNNVCFRGQQNLNGEFYILAVDWKGQGTVLQSASPWLGDNAFQQITSPLTPVYEIGTFNNTLYVSFVDRVNGFSVARLNLQGSPPYSYVTVLPNGGYKTLPNPIALSMQVYDGYLYVGGDGVRTGVPLSDQGAELFRIHSDDTWDLVQGQARSTPAGQKNPISGLNVGFSWFLNQHMWRMAVHDSRLYVGTFDESVLLRLQSGGAAYQPEFGFDLWWTEDGSYFSQVDQQGFGDGFNMGVRSLQSTPLGLFLGTANPFYGLEVFRGANTTPVNLFAAPAVSTAQADPAAQPNPPMHVQVEGGAGSVLLAWDAPSGGAQQYHIFRRSYDPIDVDVVGVGNDGPAYTHGEWEEIGTTDKLTYADSAASTFGRYAYQVKADNGQGVLSEYSNFVIYPAAAPPVSFADARESLNKLVVGGKFVDPAARDQMSDLLKQAEEDAAKGDFAKLQALWDSVKNNPSAHFANAKDAREFELALSRLSKRAQLVKAGSLSASSLSVRPAATTTTANALNCTGTPAVCTQPTTGPEGATYTYQTLTKNGPYWANNRYTNNSVEYYIYEPGTPGTTAPKKAPVILFLHGYGALDPTNYDNFGGGEGLISQMVQKGYTVVWVKYQAKDTSTFTTYPSNAQAAWTDALYRLENYTWEPHVRPYTVNGVAQTMIVGHSFGGWIAGWLAGQASSAIPSFPAPLGLVLIEPTERLTGGPPLLQAPINFAAISPTTKMVIVSGDQDNIACSQDAVSIFTSTTQLPAIQKNYLFVNSDLTGTPNQVGNHYFPNTYGYKDTAAIDNRDFYVTYKLSVAAARCLFEGSDCSIFLGNGSTEQLNMGTWSNGTAIAPMTYYADPTKLPPITGCP